MEASAAALTYDRSERTSIYIRTQEGDVVRIRLRTKESAGLEAAHASAGEWEADEVALSLKSKSSLSVSVRGDLDEEELAAIASAVQQASDLADEFFDGDVGAAFESAAALDIDAEQLSRVSLKLEASERVTYSGVRYVSKPVALPPVQAPAAAPVELAPPAVAPASPAPEAPAGESIVPGGDDAPAPSGTEAGGDGPIAAQSARDAEDSTPDPGHAAALDRIGSYLRNVFHTFGGTGGTYRARADVSWKVQLLRTALVAVSEPAGLPRLATDTLDAVTVRARERPLDAVA